MAEIPSKIKETVSKYIRALNENNFNVVRAVLFGSYAKGTYSEWSDIDLAVVSNAFEGSWIQDKKNQNDYAFHQQRHSGVALSTGGFCFGGSFCKGDY